MIDRGNDSIRGDGFPTVLFDIEDVVALQVYRTFGEAPGNRCFDERPIEYGDVWNLLPPDVSVQNEIQFL